MPNWNSVLKEIAETPSVNGQNPFDIVRRKYIAELHKYTGRNVICYYSGFLTDPTVSGIQINDDDKNGLMLCVHNLDRSKGLDLFLHTPGGDVAATESLVHYLREMFGTNIRAVVPQIAMSAGTMIACSCTSILMGKHSNIGPVDPQVNGVPAIGVVKEVEKAFGDIKLDQRAALIWNPILSRLANSFLIQCQWAIERSDDFISSVLSDGVLSHIEEKQKGPKIAQCASRLTDLNYNKGHNKHFHYQDCQDMEMNVEMLEDCEELQDLVLTIHHCFMHSLSNTSAYKIIENHMGLASIKQQASEQRLMLQVPAGKALPTKTPD